MVYSIGYREHGELRGCMDADSMNDSLAALAHGPGNSLKPRLLEIVAFFLAPYLDHC